MVRHVRVSRLCSVLGIFIGLISPLTQSQISDGGGCDQTIRSGEDPKNGTFSSPNWPRPYGNGLRCIYRFIARPNERVEIKFTQFHVRGTPPRCTHDYVDVYTRATKDEDMLDIPLHGRYCGNNLENLPHLLISMTDIFIIGLYTDSNNEHDKGFTGIYTFIDAARYMVGTPHPEEGVCGQIIRSEKVSKGILLSPTYPGMYPDNIFCFYKLIGEHGQRIKFVFQDLDLYFGGEHCPFDYVKIYDGPTNEAEEIGVYCSKYENIEVFSTAEMLTIEFVTKSGRVEPTKKPYLTYKEINDDSKLQQRGFNASFEISRNFVSLDFIKKGHHHVRGTECDQRVLSTGESEGVITSPNFPDNYPLNVTCRYYIDGLVDKQNLEKARLQFTFFDIPYRLDKCDNGYIAAFWRGQDIDKSNPDLTICGASPPDALTSSSPRLLIILDTHGNVPGHGFSAKYSFVTDYAIPGTPATDAKCHFLYYSTSKKFGYFNSPRHPSNYPHNTVCIYEFYGLVREQVRITFENFQVANEKNNCSTDWLKVFAVDIDQKGKTKETIMGIYCGGVVPGPIVTEESNILRMVFNTDHANFHAGFKARYEFIERKPRSNRCFMDIVRGGGGVICSPNYPLKYRINTTCEWHIYSSLPRGRILIEFPFFNMEGSPNISKHEYGSPPGCANAVLKIYTDNSSMAEHELCGPSLSNAIIPKHVISKGSYLKIRFISSARAVGAQGFRITWTELRDEPGPQCSGFLCKKSGFCISKALTCNGEPNCGENDNSDEATKCGSSYTDHGVLHIILGVVIALVLLIFLLVCILHRRRKARKKKNKQEIEVRYVTRGGGGLVRDPRDGGPRSDQSLLKERTEKVSIV